MEITENQLNIFEMWKGVKGTVLFTILWAERWDPFLVLKAKTFPQFLVCPCRVIPWSDSVFPE